MKVKSEPQVSAVDISSIPVQEVYEVLGTDPNGLTEQEAKNIQEEAGKNVLSEQQTTPKWKVFLRNFTSLMAILLWIGGSIAFLSGTPELGAAIFLVNVINGIFSFRQENKASQAAEMLKNMLPSYARVIRDGQEKQILAEDLVPGDIILLEEGDAVSADCRVVEASNLQVNQSTLTGEVNPVRKLATAIDSQTMTVAEIPNLIFAGTGVSEGNGKAVVLKIGMATQFGQIAGLTQNLTEEQSPLQKELNILTKQISIIALSMGVVFFVLSLVIVQDSLANAFIFALGMVVAFIPEGLLPTVTLSLSMAVQRMSKRNALVKKLSSVETLGATTVICTDKTGTLTQNEMTVSHVWTLTKEYKVTGTGYSPEGIIEADGHPVTAGEDADLNMTMAAAVLCSNARLLPPEEKGGRYTVLGDPTEACLEVAAKKAGIDIKELKNDYPRVWELPFDSRRKRMTTIQQLSKAVDGVKRIAFIKGSPKEVMELSQQAQINGQLTEMTQAMRNQIMQANDAYAFQGLRVLAVAFRYLHSTDTDIPKTMSEYAPENIEKHLIFAGLVVMADPPRAQVTEAVQLCHDAGIRIIMITGDYGLTAESIAKRTGIVASGNPRVVSGLELAALDESTLKTYLMEDIIFARVAPEQKLKVVTALQEMGEIVAVTGDGVNDSPALKKADIGVAMGITGTDVAKESADMILADDNFASIVHAIEEGRAVYANIRKFLTYILTSNVSEAVPSFFYLLSGGAIPLPLTIMQILTIDLGTDLLPALGLGTEKPEAGIMQQPPRSRAERLMSRKVLWKAFGWYGIMEAVASMCGYFFVNWQNGWPNAPIAAAGSTIYMKATTMTLATIVFSQIGVVFNIRTEMLSLCHIGIFSNKQINGGIIFEILLLTFLIYTPGIQLLFNTTGIGLADWAFLIIWPFLIILVDEGRKAILRKNADFTINV